MGYIKRITAFILAVLVLISLVGCGKAYKKEYIYFELSEKPQSLDPQTAYNDSELLIVRNIYEGLLRKDLDGNIECGAAKNYEKNGLVYEFELRHSDKWESGHKVTADDFLFGFERAVDPKTQAPFASRLFAIKNAKAIYEGRADMSSLGVKVVDEFTLTIELEYDDSHFEEVLCDSVSMPCNREFFGECRGQYGLTRDCVNSNGSYALRKWNQEDFGIRLYYNENYHGKFSAQNAAVFISLDEELTQTERLIENQSDMAFLPSAEFGIAKGQGFNIEQVQNICWYLTIGDQYSSDMKQALQSTFSQEVYKNSLSGCFEVANSIYPPFLNDDSGFAFKEYNIPFAQQKMSQAVQGYDGKVFPAATLYYAPSEAMLSAVTDIVGHWQKNISAFINIKVADNPQELSGQLKEKSLPFAVFSCQAKSSDVSEYLSVFGLSHLDGDTAEQQLCDQGNILPIAYESTNVAYNPKLQNVKMFDTNGYIDFSFIIKTK